MRIEVNTSDEGVVVCAIYPSRHGENTCDFEGSHQHNDNNDVVVDFEIAVPRGVPAGGSRPSTGPTRWYTRCRRGGWTGAGSKPATT